MSNHPSSVANASISVLMPVYSGDRLADLQLAIASVENQEERPDEFVIVVDGPIPHDHSQYLENWSANSHIENVRLVRTPKNLGIALALNRGIKECTQTLIMRMDADDLSTTNRVADTKREFLRTSADFLYSGAVEFLNETQQVTYLKNAPKHEGVARAIRLRNRFCHPAVTIRREVLVSVGSYRDCAPFEDHDLFLRLANSGVRFHRFESPHVFVRTSRAQRGRRSGLQYAMKAASVRKSWLDEGLLTWADLCCGVVGISGFSLLPDFVRRFAYKVLRSPIPAACKELYAKELLLLTGPNR